jgi:hypothetical protein
MGVESLNLGLWKCHTRGVTEEVVIPQKAAENTGVSCRRTSHFRHLGLWFSEYDNTSEFVIQLSTVQRTASARNRDVFLALQQSLTG